MTEAEVNAFFTTLADKDKLRQFEKTKKLVLLYYFYFLYGCGARTFEARRLLVENAHPENGYVDIMKSKGNRDRRIFLSEELANKLSEYNKEIHFYYPDRKYFFPHNSDTCFCNLNISDFFNSVWKAAGLSIDPRKKPSPYSFRHYFAFTNLRRWLEEGRDVNVMITYLMRVMGHSSIRSTMYYLAASPDIYGTCEKTIRQLEEERLPEVISYEE